MHEPMPGVANYVANQRHVRIQRRRDPTKDEQASVDVVHEQPHEIYSVRPTKIAIATAASRQTRRPKVKKKFGVRKAL